MVKDDLEEKANGKSNISIIPHISFGEVARQYARDQHILELFEGQYCSKEAARKHDISEEERRNYLTERRQHGGHSINWQANKRLRDWANMSYKSAI